MVRTLIGMHKLLGISHRMEREATDLNMKSQLRKHTDVTRLAGAGLDLGQTASVQVNIGFLALRRQCYQQFQTYQFVKSC